jgi:hypothetical protein
MAGGMPFLFLFLFRLIPSGGRNRPRASHGSVSPSRQRLRLRLQLRLRTSPATPRGAIHSHRPGRPAAPFPPRPASFLAHRGSLKETFKPTRSLPRSPMPASHAYRFCFGPWNISEGADPYGPPTRPPQTFGWKLTQLKALGFEAMMFHDDDAVPDIDSKSEAQIMEEARELKRRLDGEGIVAEMVAPRLWFSPMTIDGAYTPLHRHRPYPRHRSPRPLACPRRHLPARGQGRLLRFRSSHSRLQCHAGARSQDSPRH